MNYDLDFLQQWLMAQGRLDRAVGGDDSHLRNAQQLAEIFGHPELAYKSYHVTGSKGKGSLSKMLACILAEMAGPETVGVYASPHVYDFRERASKAVGFFDDQIYNAAVQELVQTMERLPAEKSIRGWQELNTMFGALVFRKAGVQRAVFEVGMGGRLDATNIIQPEFCCITEIELEHSQFLGNSLPKIATEKAGIIKSGRPVVVAAQKTAAVRAVFRRIAEEKRAPIYFVDDLAQVRELNYNAGRLCCKVESEVFRRPLELQLQMLGQVQALNAAQAALAIKLVYPETDEALIERGLAKASLPGRFEQRGKLILDGSHTAASIADCVQTFVKLHPERPRNLLFGIAASKDLAKIVPEFRGLFDQIYITRPGDFKKSDLEAMEEAFRQAGMAVIADADYGSLIRRALAESADKALLTTGSFYLLDEVNKVLKSLKTK